MSRLKDWIQAGREKGASDLLLETATPLAFRIRGELQISGDSLAHDLLMEVIRGLLDPASLQEFSQRGSFDLSKTMAGVRCRINIFRTIRGVGLAVRLLSSFQNNIHDCNLHPDLKRFAVPRTGLVIISGPTGSGKSTTLTALLEEINMAQRRHMITIESPIEYFLSNRKSLIRQREVPTHTPSFEQAIIDSLRESPDVLVIGEMRTPEVMRLTLNAAETGHLVFATMHSSTCAEALARVCMSFPAEIQGSVQAQLADCLIGVVCQRLDYLPAHQIRVPQCEILVANAAARTTIRTGQFSQMASVLQTSGDDGMWTFERYQRWAENKKDWVRPSQARPLAEDSVQEKAFTESLAPIVKREAVQAGGLKKPPAPTDR